MCGKARLLSFSNGDAVFLFQPGQRQFVEERTGAEQVEADVVNFLKIFSLLTNQDRNLQIIDANISGKFRVKISMPGETAKPDGKLASQITLLNRYG